MTETSTENTENIETVSNDNGSNTNETNETNGSNETNAEDITSLDGVTISDMSNNEIVELIKKEVIKGVIKELKEEIKSAVDALTAKSLNADELLNYLKRINAFTKYGNKHHHNEIKKILMTFTENYRGVVVNMGDILAGKGVNTLVDTTAKGGEHILEALSPVIKSLIQSITEGITTALTAIPVYGSAIAGDKFLKDTLNTVNENVEEFNKATSAVTDVTTKINNVINPPLEELNGLIGEYRSIKSQLEKISKMGDMVQNKIKLQIMNSLLCGSSSNGKLGLCSGEPEEVNKKLLDILNTIGEIDMEKMDTEAINKELAKIPGLKGDMKILEEMGFITKLTEKLNSDNIKNEINNEMNITKGSSTEVNDELNKKDEVDNKDELDKTDGNKDNIKSSVNSKPVSTTPAIAVGGGKHNINKYKKSTKKFTKKGGKKSTTNKRRTKKNRSIRYNIDF